MKESQRKAMFARLDRDIAKTLHDDIELLGDDGSKITLHALKDMMDFTKDEREEFEKIGDSFEKTADKTFSFYRYPLKEIKQEKKAIVDSAHIPTGQENPPRWLKQLGTAGLSTPDKIKREFKQEKK